MEMVMQAEIDMENIQQQHCIKFLTVPGIVFKNNFNECI